jgi:ribosomal protein S27AE
MKAQTVLLRELVGNPYRPGSIDRSRLAWRGRTIPDLARAIYDDCEDERFAILADALEEAGCGSPELVAHCRGREFCGKCHGTGFRDLGRRIPCTRCEGWGWRNVSIEHIRGCWVLDLLLGKV